MIDLTQEQKDRIEREWALTRAYVAPIEGMLVGAALCLIAAVIFAAYSCWG